MIQFFFLGAAITTYYLFLKWILRLVMIKLIINSVSKSIENQLKNLKEGLKNDNRGNEDQRTV